MKRFLMTFCVVLSTLLMSTGVFAAEEKTDAFIKLANSIIGQVEDEESDEYVVYDENGNFWRADFADNGNIISLYTIVEDEEDAKEIADELGDVVEYSIPFTTEYDEPLVKEVLVPVYKNSQVDILCARPVSLYASGEKNIKSIDLGDNDVLVFDTRANSSFKAVIACGDLTAQHLWGDSWIPEEELGTSTVRNIGSRAKSSLSFNYDVNKVVFKEGRKPVEPKPVEPKPVEPEPIEAKPADNKDFVPESDKITDEEPDENEGKFKFELPQDKKDNDKKPIESATNAEITTEISTEETSENTEVTTAAEAETKMPYEPENKPLVEITTGAPLEITTEAAVEATTESVTEATTKAAVEVTTERASEVTTSSYTQPTTRSNSETSTRTGKYFNPSITTETTTAANKNSTANKINNSAAQKNNQNNSTQKNNDNVQKNTNDNRQQQKNDKSNRNMR